MKFEMFTEVELKQDIPEHNISKSTIAIIVDYCPRNIEEDGYILEVLDQNGNGCEIIAVAESQISVCENAIV